MSHEYQSGLSIYIYKFGSEVLRAFVVWPPGLLSVTEEGRSSSITDLNIRKTDKGQNIFIGVVGEKNAGQI